ncbi:MAG: bifunctional PIG-L family deacetylase/class I SAM-dependent methyltransferase [Mucilaginibacter sp.]|uniref:bifunctional PIG-L family deacetylase/class I SAM-dependent methyltransferase n=1 Tax=Mucilaginibacter sp. TaxID=1882438 RepID=UPI0034E4BC67
MVTKTERKNWQQHATEISANDLKQFGTTVVISPHEDDESLGCGGTIALLRQMDVPVFVVFVSDGSKSHPNSKKFPAEKLRELREAEALKALQILDVPMENASFMRLKDTAVPNQNFPDFDAAVQQMLEILKGINPKTILVTWEKDPHADHRSSWQILNQAVLQLETQPRVLQYLIWIWELGKKADISQDEAVKWFQVNIKPVAEIKKKAVEAHASQTTRLIDDDPEGFILSPEILAHFDDGEELFIESKPFVSDHPEKANSLSADFFNEFYSHGDDPWHFESSPYERSKYQATLAALPREIYQNAFEIGCSIGVLTKMLAPKCKKLLAVEPADVPLQKAKERLKADAHVQLQKMFVPQDFPQEQFDLILLSEVGYFLSWEDLQKLAGLMTEHLQPGGQLLLVHWTPVVAEFPLTGDEVHDYFLNLCQQKKHMKQVLHQRHEKFRLDLFEKN